MCRNCQRHLRDHASDAVGDEAVEIYLKQVAGECGLATVPSQCQGRAPI